MTMYMLLESNHSGPVTMRDRGQHVETEVMRWKCTQWDFRLTPHTGGAVEARSRWGCCNHVDFGLDLLRVFKLVGV